MADNPQPDFQWLDDLVERLVARLLPTERLPPPPLLGVDGFRQRPFFNILDGEDVAIWRALLQGTPDGLLTDGLSETLQKTVWALVRYEIYRLDRAALRRQQWGAQRRAWRLLKALLNPDQQQKLDSSRCFFVTGSLTRERYRIYPQRGLTEHVVWHRSRWYADVRFCLHDPESRLPPADVALAHLLWLRADELGFLATANHTACGTELWNGEYRRRLNANRRRDQAERAAYEAQTVERAATGLAHLLASPGEPPLPPPSPNVDAWSGLQVLGEGEAVVLQAGCVEDQRRQALSSSAQVGA